VILAALPESGTSTSGRVRSQPGLTTALSKVSFCPQSAGGGGDEAPAVAEAAAEDVGAPATRLPSGPRWFRTKVVTPPISRTATAASTICACRPSRRRGPIGPGSN
jgi:hypothetical protein